MEFHFTEEDHSYRCLKTGQIYPSVTQILRDPAGDVDALMKWASTIAVEQYGRFKREEFNLHQQRLYKMRVKDIKPDSRMFSTAYKSEVDKAAEVGTMIHDHLFKPLPENAPRQVHNGIRGWHDFLKSGPSIQLLGYEEMVGVHCRSDFDLDYAGTYDLLFELNGRMILADVKTSRRRRDTWPKQLAGYAQALRLKGTPIDELWVILLDPRRKCWWDIIPIDRAVASMQWNARLSAYYADRQTAYTVEEE